MLIPSPTLDSIRPTAERLTLFANFGGSLNRNETLWLRNLIVDLALAVDLQSFHAGRIVLKRSVMGGTYAVLGAMIVLTVAGAC